MSKLKIFRNNATIDPPRTPGPHGTPPGPVRAWQRPRVSFAPPASACLHELIWPRGERSSFIMQKKITQTMLRTTSHARRGTLAPPRDQPQRGCVPRRHLRSRHSCAHTAQRLRAMRYEYLKINRVAAEYCMVVENERGASSMSTKRSRLMTNPVGVAPHAPFDPLPMCNTS